MLTENSDTVVGSSGNDTIISGEKLLGLNAGTAVYAPNLQATDNISGGAGVDTLKVTTESEIKSVAPTMTGVEVIELSSGGAVTFDASAYADVTTLKAVKSVGDIKLTAAATADISASGTSGTSKIDAIGGKAITIADAASTGAITVGDAVAKVYAAGDISVTDTKQENAITIDGGASVTVSASAKDATGDIAVGKNKAATGAVAVTQNLNSTGDALDNSTKKIEVKGGSTVAVTVNGTITADAAADNGHALKASEIIVTGDGKTTNVTATQNLTATNFSKAGSAAINDKETLTFKALVKGESVTVDGLTFTASKDLAAADVAAAFANLTKDDTQTATGPTANGFYNGALNTKWTSAAASGASVLFTSTDIAQNTKLVVTSTATAKPDEAYVDGKAAGSDETAKVSVVYNNVSVTDDTAAAIKTVTLNGFADASLTAMNALETLSLTNSAGDTKLETSKTALSLSVNDITGTVDLDNATNDQSVKTLTLTATGKESAFDLTAEAVTDATIDAQVKLDLSGLQKMGALQNVTIKGAGAVDLGDISTYVKLDSFNASANTGGVTATVEAEIDATKLTGKITDYVFSAGADDVAIKGSTIETNINLGAGDDKLTLATGTSASVGVLDGGTGTNTISMDAAAAQTLSATNAFEAKMSNFSRLEVDQVATGVTKTVYLDNLDDISYVTTKGTFDAKQTATVTVASTTTRLAADGTDTASITINGKTYTTATLTAGADAAGDATAIAAALKAALNGVDGFTANNVAGVLTISGANGDAFTVSDFKITGTGVTTEATDVTSSQLVLKNMADNGTVVLTDAGMGVKVDLTDASGAANVLNVITKDLESNQNVGTVTAKGVETINVTTTDTYVDDAGATDIFGTVIGDGKDDANSSGTLRLSGDVLKTVKVGGAGDLTLNVTSTVLTSVDAGSMTGSLVFTATGAAAGTTVTAGSGDDTLYASGEKDVLKGGAGNDTITAGDLTQVYGGAGNDIFKFGVNSNLTKVSTVNDVNAGDVFKLVDVVNTNANVTKFYTAGAQYNANTTTDVAGKVNAALVQTGAGEATWFQHGGNTYLVIDNAADGKAAGADDTYVAGKDIVIEIVGLINLTNASFNATDGTLEIA